MSTKSKGAASWVALVVYVPEAFAAAVKAAAFAAGAGHIGNYDCCCWQTPGTGQFRPLPGSQPFCGTADTVSGEPELKLEMLCPAPRQAAVLAAIAAAHPYDTPVMFAHPVDFPQPSHSCPCTASWP